MGSDLVVSHALSGAVPPLALANRGIPSIVIEKQKEIASSKWVMLLYPQGLRIFDELGVLEDTLGLGL